MASGIKDKVAIIGMGCSRFGERWDCGAEHLMLEAFDECLADAGIEKAQIEAAWLGLCYQEQSLGKSSISLSQSWLLWQILARCLAQRAHEVESSANKFGLRSKPISKCHADA